MCAFPERLSPDSRRLTEVADERGIALFEATVLPENHRMIEVFRESGFPVTTRSEPGEIVVEFPTSLSNEARARFEDRDRGASVAALQAFLEPASVAAGGTAAELLGEVQVRLTPLTDRDAAEMVRALRTFPLLDGYRGAPRTDVAGLEDVPLRVAAMVEEHPEIAELDLNPVLVSPGGALAVDARVRVEKAPPPRPWPAVG